MGRRHFLEAAGAAAAAAAFPVPLFAQRGPARVRLGFVGFGQRGVQLARAARGLPGVEITAVADLYEGRRARAAEVAGEKAFTTGEVRRVIESKDVDAVVIATPDHWHAPLALLAADAGKDVYCEAPLTHSLQEEPALAKAFGSGRVLQCGGARVTSPLYALAKEQIQAGRLGRVTLVHGIWETSTALDAWLVPFPPDASPESIDFKAFLGKAPAREFDLHRFFRWQRYWDYSSGLAGARFTVQLSAIQWLLDAKGPQRVTAAGGVDRWKDGREVPDIITAVFEYPEGFTATLTATQNGGRAQELRVVGTGGTLVIGEDRLSLLPEPLSEPYPEVGESWPKEHRDWFYMIHSMTPDGQLRGGAAAIKAAELFEAPAGASPVVAHLGDFVDAVRSRRAPKEPVALGLAAAGAAHRANQAYREGRSVRR